MHQPIRAGRAFRISLRSQEDDCLADSAGVDLIRPLALAASDPAIYERHRQDGIAQPGNPQATLDMRLDLAVALEVDIAKMILPVAQLACEVILVGLEPGSAGQWSGRQPRTAGSGGEAGTGFPSTLGENPVIG